MNVDKDGRIVPQPNKSEIPKPCPFCGANPEIWEIEGSWGIDCFTVNCPASSLTSGDQWRRNRENALALWNTRNQPAPADGGKEE